MKNTDINTAAPARYRVYQSFATLGDPCAEYASTLAEAAEIAERQINDIARMIAEDPHGLGAPEELDDDGNPSRRSGRTGCAGEHAAWDAAHDAAGHGNPLTLAAARIVAAAAVQIDEAQCDDLSP